MKRKKRNKNQENGNKAIYAVTGFVIGVIASKKVKIKFGKKKGNFEEYENDGNSADKETVEIDIRKIIREEISTELERIKDDMGDLRLDLSEMERREFSKGKEIKQDNKNKETKQDNK